MSHHPTSADQGQKPSATIDHHQALDDVLARVNIAAEKVNRSDSEVSLVAVSKTFDVDNIHPVIKAGQRIFGENRVQEAMSKWPALKKEFTDIELHLIGPLQTNKVKEAVALFDSIETLDRVKLAKALAKEMKKQERFPTLFIQVNTGEESQKAGVFPDDVDAFITYCRTELDLEIKGLMCIPPVDEEPSLHFALLRNIAQRNQVDGLSMGMSGDFETAVEFGATNVRVGSAIFGGRTYRTA